jgi:glycine betaine/proline transport system permease protein
MVVLLALTYWGSRSIKLVIRTVLAFVFIGYFRMWEETMSTIAIILTSVIMAVAIGLPTGIAMSRSDRTQSIVTPILGYHANYASIRLSYSHCHVNGYW